MADIIIEEPIKMELSIIETDVHVPSLEILCLLNDIGLMGKFDMEFLFWVKCENWDLFVKQESHNLYDMSDILRISITTNRETNYCELLINPSISIGRKKIESTLLIPMSFEEKEIFLSKFRDFQKCW